MGTTFFGSMRGFQMGGELNVLPAICPGTDDITKPNSVAISFCNAPCEGAYAPLLLEGVTPMPSVLNESDLNDVQRTKGWGGDKARRMVLGKLTDVQAQKKAEGIPVVVRKNLGMGDKDG